MWLVSQKVCSIHNTCMKNVCMGKGVEDGLV